MAAPWHVFLDLSPDAALVVDGARTIADANAAAHRMFGYAHGQLPGLPLDALLPPEVAARHAAHTAAFFAAPTRREMGQNNDIYARRRDGSVFPADVALGHLDHDGVRYAVATVRDRSELVRLRADAAAQRRLHTAAIVSAAFAHDVRTPLMMVQASLELAEEALAAGQLPALPALLADARGGVRQLDEVVTDFLDMARADGARAEATVELGGLVRSTARVARSRLGSSISLAVDAPAPVRVIGPGFRWVQVLFTLVDNAARACSERGLPRATIRASVHADAGFGRLSVADPGVGMPPEVRARLFTPFFSTYLGRGGNGLGLWSCGEHVRAAGGRMEVESEPGRGTTVHAWIPLA